MSLTTSLIGFVAGAVAVFTAHEVISFILYKTGLFPRQPWSLKSAAVIGVPQIISDMFWGGVWGVVFAAVYNYLPGGSAMIKGLIFAIIGPALLGVFILVPLLTKRFPVFFDGDLQKIASVLLILSGFGAAMGYVFNLLGGI